MGFAVKWALFLKEWYRWICMVVCCFTFFRSFSSFYRVFSEYLWVLYRIFFLFNFVCCGLLDVFLIFWIYLGGGGYLKIDRRCVVRFWWYIFYFLKLMVDLIRWRGVVIVGDEEEVDGHVWVFCVWRRLQRVSSKHFSYRRQGLVMEIVRNAVGILLRDRS